MNKGNKRNLIAGQVYEEYLVKKLNNLGVFATLCRSVEIHPSLDAQMMDICPVDSNLKFPYHIQAKSTVKTVQYYKLLEDMDQFIKDNRIPVILHKKTVNESNRYLTQGSYAILFENDFFRVIKELESYRKAYQELMQFWDTIPEEYKNETHQNLKDLNL